MEFRSPEEAYEWEEQLADPWQWNDAHAHLDGWKLNHNPSVSPRCLMELGRDFGPITIPHRNRRFVPDDKS
ncbi:MAG TPA: hypothetical protein GX008_07240 [Firmicutes bacterium]|nr:MAG: hypothetical protein AA931_00760 [Peptococcaceae bacterium 1109]HHT73491.1 hypothetical protein [Bacillota bacterium]